MKILKRDFFAHFTVKVAKKLLGKILIRKIGENKLSGKIVEVEAYLGKEDPASHASFGKTPRNSVMFGKPGFAYVYFCYGNHYMMNVVTEKEGIAGAVLIRALEPYKCRLSAEINGPGKLTKALRIGKGFNGYDLTKGKKIYLADDGLKKFKIKRSGRIGIKKGCNKLFRFYIAGNKNVS